MNDEIKEILRIAKECHYIDISFEESDLLLDYITNLQQENERQSKAQVILDDMLANYKQENKRLKELCDKYEEEHNTVFQEWQKDIQANKKAIEYIEEMLYPIGTCVNGSDLPYESIESLLNILQNGSEENVSDRD